MRLLLLPPRKYTQAHTYTELRDDKPKKRHLVWEEDKHMHSKFLDRKDELKAEHASYLWQHPELCAMMADFLQFLLPRKPSDVFMFAHKDFFPFASHRPPQGPPSIHTLCLRLNSLVDSSHRHFSEDNTLLVKVKIP
ncbi:hypothetical protein J4Q44_G00132320 [Coregonus suidteri]|uniref:Uncharacterized protein n=1 Tax=Coregonus suidteri TaxID=861788 RepID=A0AAN8QYN5_9TELE